MGENEELDIILDRKNFKTFFHCFEFLLTAGYPEMESFSIALKRFGESKVWENIAYYRFESVLNKIETEYPTFSLTPLSEKFLLCFIMDDKNIHLSGLYDTYRKDMADITNVFNIDDLSIDNSCEKIKIKLKSRFIIKYLIDLYQKHFGLIINDGGIAQYKSKLSFIPPYYDNHGRVSDDRIRINTLQESINRLGELNNER